MERYEVIAPKLLNLIRENYGYCLCALEHDQDHICPCKEFRENTPVGKTCHCGVYLKEEVEDDQR